MKAIAGLIALALLWGTLAAAAEDTPPPPGCEVPANLLTSENTLKKVAEAVKTEGRLDIMVIGSRSATVLAPDGHVSEAGDAPTAAGAPTSNDKEGSGCGCGVCGTGAAAPATANAAVTPPVERCGSSVLRMPPSAN